MQSRQRISAEIDYIKTLTILAQAYEEISVMKMQRIRNTVVKTRDFVEKLTEVFHDVRSSYKEKIKAMMRQRNKEDKDLLSIIEKNGKTVNVFISANAKLYGNIVFRVFRDFKEQIVKTDDDIVIIGRLGRDLYEEYNLEKQYSYYDIPDTNIEIDDIKAIIYNLINYRTINIFYGKFESIVTQNTAISNISGNNPINFEEKGTVVNNFLFEPSLEQLISFFETQILTSLFKQTLHESQLARYASRITAMEEILQHIESQAGRLTMLQHKIKNQIAAKKQHQIISGISLWSK